MPVVGPRGPSKRLADVISALTYALDLTEGERSGHALRTALYYAMKLPLLSRILLLAQSLEAYWTENGIDAVRNMTQQRRGRWCDPGLDSLAYAFAAAIDAKTPYTARCRETLRAGLLLDIGERGISNRILDKTGTLTDEELGEIRKRRRWTWEILWRVRAVQGVRAGGHAAS
jgi:hypothetical protein